MKVLICSVLLALQIARAKAFKPILQIQDHYEDKHDIFWFGNADPDQITDEEIIEYIKANAETCYHPVSTCKIGIDERDSVVDASLKVHGVTGLRIADASIFPEQISGHPVGGCTILFLNFNFGLNFFTQTATVIAIGEKASDMIMSVA
jgi:choline dehydrogenase